jgi:signal transduction histidine kinase
MNTFDTALFPFPHLLHGKMHPGSLFDWPKICHACKTHTCSAADDDELHLCSYGYNYQRVKPSIIVGGFLIREYPGTSKARRKRFSAEPHLVIAKVWLDSCIQIVKDINFTIDQEVRNEITRLVTLYAETEQYKADFLNPLREEIQKGLSFVHDYKQINTQISQNINVVIENRYRGDSLEEKLNKATREERSIYEAAKFLDEKLNIAKFLMHPEWLEQQAECVSFRFHGAVLKYRRIYSHRFEGKGVNVTIQGQSTAEVVANPQAVAVIPHTFLDNAAKYSPREGRVEIYVQDIEAGIEFAVSSFGPRILPREKNLIFHAFYRGECAKGAEEEGAGYGLYLSQLVAKRHLGTTIDVDQEEKNTGRLGHWTTFSIRIPLQAIILQDE